MLTVTDQSTLSPEYGVKKPEKKPAFVSGRTLPYRPGICYRYVGPSRDSITVQVEEIDHVYDCIN